MALDAVRALRHVGYCDRNNLFEVCRESTVGKDSLADLAPIRAVCELSQVLSWDKLRSSWLLPSVIARLRRRGGPCEAVCQRETAEIFIKDIFGVRRNDTQATAR